MNWSAAEADRLHARLRVVEVFELVVAQRPAPGTVVPLVAHAHCPVAIVR